MINCRWKWIVGALLFCSLQCSGFDGWKFAAAQPSADSSSKEGQYSSEQIQKWINDLESHSYALREKSSRMLYNAGTQAIGPLVKAAEGDRLETANRAIRVLTELSHSKDRILSLKVLEHLSGLNKYPLVRSDADSHLAKLRFKASLAKLQKLKCNLGYMPYSDGEQQLVSIQIGPDWRGGDQGLRYVRDLRTLYLVSIHSAPITDQGVLHLKFLRGLERIELYGTKVTQAAVTELRKALPNTEIDVRGNAKLGIAGQRHLDGAIILQVVVGSSAMKAGIQVGDVITHADGVQVKDFDELTQIIGKKSLGDQLKVELNRDNQKIKMEIELGQWK